MNPEELRKIPIFRVLDEEEVARMLRITAERNFAGGELIMKEGEEGDTMYLVLEGEVEVSKTLTMKFGEGDFREAEKILSRYRPEDHEVFGEMALIGRETRSATITAVKDCRLLEIKRDDFLRLMEEEPAMGVKVLLEISRLLISRLRQASRDVTRLTTALSIALGT
ncbi:MAG: cyclic nucleotide-binding domain-containing protein [Deltaproteobacteria bacterium]|nr:cyclic nucleotide-binding domain-containing protein [Deltaproteobacteria bacterium]MBW1922138.1 cyclic nucleotide-binding domain-containing protein [Deltaproteobacteria bacterium]MBW1947955.1 cyclic nucleotide-binding domain-containing protein [Deltaproteobacteria bacterium]MBW2007310.1 cyclic nucleotide-binding domain-containing protein [Deltaproteobacteria bacterium]MBW2102369.1 cyclic nucleotide-binding domain-containing protein [Deltaproteobacteria bacterium]